MNRAIPRTSVPAVKRWQSREEIRKEYLDSLSPDALREIEPSYYWLKFGLPAWQRECARKYDPSQPRVPAGNSDGGQWTSSNESTVQRIVEMAKRLNLAARPDAYQRCLDLCYRLLERPQSPGSDRNTWDFHKCMNACLGRNL
jgi:hypothetical protein